MDGDDAASRRAEAGERSSSTNATTRCPFGAIAKHSRKLILSLLIINVPVDPFLILAVFRVLLHAWSPRSSQLSKHVEPTAQCTAHAAQRWWHQGATQGVRRMQCRALLVSGLCRSVRVCCSRPLSLAPCAVQLWAPLPCMPACLCLLQAHQSNGAAAHQHASAFQQAAQVGSPFRSEAGGAGPSGISDTSEEPMAPSAPPTMFKLSGCLTLLGSIGLHGDGRKDKDEAGGGAQGAVRTSRKAGGKPEAGCSVQVRA